MKRPRPAHWVALAGALVGAAIVIAFAFRASLNGWAREQVISNLRDSFASDLEFSALNVSLLPHAHLDAKNVILRYHGRKDLAPLIEIKAFSADSSVFGFLRRHVGQVRVDGLRIHVPPRSERPAGTKPDKPRSSGIVIDHLSANNAMVEITPSEAGKQPLEFDIHQLTMRSVARDRPAPFQATLTNARPPGEIAVQGQFGPWNIDEPSQTPLTAGYTLVHADLGVFRGISGALSSKGKFNGVLDHIEVYGETETPDFTLKISGHPVSLRTQFHAIVDGTNGDTLLTPVNAEFGRSKVEANGGVVRASGRGRDVSLNATVTNGRLEDMLRLAVKGQKFMTGRVGFQTKLDLPPGDADVADRLRLDGEFGVTSARFTQLNVEEKVKDLSRRAQGEPENPAAGSDVSNLRGRFKLRDGVINFSNLAFSVAGAALLLNGSYGLHDERLDFHGTVKLEAKLSQTTTGLKSFLLKAVDPFFKKKKGVGSEVPIRITGTRSNPSYGIDFRHK